MAMLHFQDFEKKAVAIEESWLTQLGVAVSKLFPNIEVKCFSCSQQDKAMEWLN